MTYVVTSNCVDCRYTDCAEVCPVEAFHIGPRMLYINPETCIDCDACRTACPVEAIYTGDDVPESEQKFLEINAEGAKKYPTTSEKIEALSTQKTLEQIREEFPEGIQKVSGELV